jgi:thioredoxin reductase (NADPH)
VVLVGGGNSAGQAAVYLSAHAARVRMMVRGPGLAASMSRYLIDRITATPNIDLLTGTEVTGLEGDPARQLEAVSWTCRETGASETAAIRNLFLFVGADPETGFLSGCQHLGLDAQGFVPTGLDAPGARPGKPSLEASLPGVFAIGDVRAGSVKRVGAAIGEGAMVVAQIHAHLAARDGLRVA